MHIKDWKKEVFTIPNLLSLFRLALIPVYIYIYLGATETYQYITAGTIMAVSCLTDLIDGKVARRFNMVSTLGKILDPLADKITQFTLTVCLSLKHPQLFPVLAVRRQGAVSAHRGGGASEKRKNASRCADGRKGLHHRPVYQSDRTGAVSQRGQYGGQHYCGGGRGFSGHFLCQLYSGVLWEKCKGSGFEKRIKKKSVGCFRRTFLFQKTRGGSVLSRRTMIIFSLHGTQRVTGTPLAYPQIFPRHRLSTLSPPLYLKYTIPPAAIGEETLNRRKRIS